MSDHVSKRQRFRILKSRLPISDLKFQISNPNVYRVQNYLTFTKNTDPESGTQKGRP